MHTDSRLLADPLECGDCIAAFTAAGGRVRASISVNPCSSVVNSSFQDQGTAQDFAGGEKARQKTLRKSPISWYIFIAAPGAAPGAFGGLNQGRRHVLCIPIET